jgi:hypothetical protein
MTAAPISFHAVVARSSRIECIHQMQKACLVIIYDGSFNTFMQPNLADI